jgi:hypothetical protein
MISSTALPSWPSRFAGLIWLLVLSGCAANSPSPSSPDPDKPKPAAAVPEKINIAATEALIKQMRGRGYKPIDRNGILLFCRSEGQLGTHFVRTRCNTVDELKHAELTGQEWVKQIQQQASPTPQQPMQLNQHP